MSTYAAPISVKQAALLAAGIQPITSESSPGDRNRFLKARYEPIVRDLLTKHAWNFARVDIALTYQGQNTFGEYLYAYDQPTDPYGREVLNYRTIIKANTAASYSAYARSAEIDFEIYDGKIVSNVKAESSELVLICNVRVGESAWPADFAEAVVKTLAAECRKSLKKDMEGARALEGEARMALMRAIAREREQSKREQPFDRQLVDVWTPGYRRRL